MSEIGGDGEVGRGGCRRKLSSHTESVCGLESESVSGAEEGCSRHCGDVEESGGSGLCYHFGTDFYHSSDCDPCLDDGCFLIGGIDRLLRTFDHLDDVRVQLKNDWQGVYHLAPGLVWM